jgi:hypothetical protein
MLYYYTPLGDDGHRVLELEGLHHHGVPQRTRRLVHMVSRIGLCMSCVCYGYIYGCGYAYDYKFAML